LNSATTFDLTTTSKSLASFYNLRISLNEQNANQLAFDLHDIGTMDSTLNPDAPQIATYVVGSVQEHYWANIYYLFATLAASMQAYWRREDIGSVLSRLFLLRTHPRSHNYSPKAST
jgi:hypothetical protein